jgi:hypothetical protein
MSKSQGKSDPQNTKEAPPKRDSKNLKAGGIFGSVWCLWSYLLDTAIKRWKTSFIKFTELLGKSVWFFILVFVILSIVIIIVVIKFPKSSKIVTTLFSALIIIISTYVLFVFILYLYYFLSFPSLALEVS